MKPSLPAPTRRTRTVVSTVAVVLLLIGSIVGPLFMGFTAISTVSVASAAPDHYEGFEDGNADGWQNVDSVQNTGYNGSYSAVASTTGGDKVLWNDVTTASGANITYLFKSQSDVVNLLNEHDTNNRNLARIKFANNEVTIISDGSSGNTNFKDDPTTLNKGTWYVAKMYTDGSGNVCVYVKEPGENSKLSDVCTSNIHGEDSNPGFLPDGDSEDVTLDSMAVNGGLNTGSEVSGTITDDDGNAVGGATVTTGTGTSTTTASDGTYSLTLADGSYDLTAYKEGYMNETKSVTVSGATTVDFTLSARAVKGRVLTCPATNPDCKNPPGIKDGTTVQIYGVHENNVTAEQGETLEERAAEIRDEMKSFDAEQIGWDPDLALTGSDGRFQNVNEKYVAVHNPADWGLRGWTDSPTLESPILTADSGQDIILSVWDPTSNPTFQDGVDSSLPGTVDDDTKIVIEQLDYTGSVVDTRRVSTTQTYNVGGVGGSHDFARVSLPDGFYRVSPEGSSVSYVITVGSPEDLTQSITEDLQNDADQLTERAERIQQLLNQDKVYKDTTATYTKNGEKGHFEFKDVPEDVNVVAVQAYTPSASEYGIDDPANASIQDLREIAASDTYNGSFYVTQHPKDVRVPSNNVRIKAVEVSATPLMDMGRFQNKSEWLQDLIQNSTFADTVSEYLDTSPEDTEEIRNQLETLREENSELNDRYLELLDEYENANGDTDAEQEIRLLKQSIRELEGELEAQDPTSSYEDGTASATIPWDGDISSDAYSVTAHFPNQGTSKPVPDEYLSVEKRTGQGDVIHVSEFPVPDGTKMVSFGVTVNGEDGEGVGNTRVNVKNPDYNGNFLNIKSMGLSTVRPGPGEEITLSVNGAEDSAQIQKVGATVEGPNGAVTATSDSNETIRFSTNGKGAHYVTLEIQDQNGINWTEKVTVKAAGQNVDQPPSIRVRDGFTGTYVIASDGIRDGSVSVDGSQVTMTAITPSDDVPGNVHFYTEQVSSSYDTSKVVVMKDSPTGAKSVSKHVQVYLHTKKLSEDAILYRNGDEPLVLDGSTGYGSVMCEESSDGCTIKSYTDAGGTATFTVNNHPNIVDRAIHFARVNIPVNLLFLMVLPTELPVPANVPPVQPPTLGLETATMANPVTAGIGAGNGGVAV